MTKCEYCPLRDRDLELPQCWHYCPNFDPASPRFNLKYTEIVLALAENRLPRPPQMDIQVPVSVQPTPEDVAKRDALQLAAICPYLIRKTCCEWGRCTIGRGNGPEDRTSAENCIDCIANGRNTRDEPPDAPLLT